MLAAGVPARIEVEGDLLRPPTRDILGEQGIETIADGLLGSISVRHEGGHLSLGVHPRIGAAAHRHPSRVLEELGQSGLDLPLDRSACALDLPAHETGSVIFEGELEPSLHPSPQNASEVELEPGCEDGGVEVEALFSLDELPPVLEGQPGIVDASLGL